MSTEDELGFIVEEDQSDRDLPEADGWQAQYNKCMRRSWLQGHKARTEFPDMTVSGNPYLDRGDDLVALTSALGWEDGFLASEAGKSAEDCPYPEG